MFDVGFSELVVIFVLALLVLGPERLPRVASQVGQWAGKARRMARMLSTQFQEEMNAMDPRRIMDPPPAATPDYSRPGVDDLKAKDAATHDPAPAQAAADPAEEGATSEPDGQPPSGDARP